MSVSVLTWYVSATRLVPSCSLPPATVALAAAAPALKDATSTVKEVSDCCGLPAQLKAWTPGGSGRLRRTLAIGGGGGRHQRHKVIIRGVRAYCGINSSCCLSSHGVVDGEGGESSSHNSDHPLSHIVLITIPCRRFSGVAHKVHASCKRRVSGVRLPKLGHVRCICREQCSVISAVSWS